MIAELLLLTAMLVLLYAPVIVWLIGRIVQDHSDTKIQTVLSDRDEWQKFVEDEYGDSDSVFYIV